MCLGVPGQIVRIEGATAVVDFWGTQKRVKLDILEDLIVVGDYIINHAGYAIRRIDSDRVAETLGMYEVILSEAGEDPVGRCASEELETLEEELVPA